MDTFFDPKPSDDETTNMSHMFENVKLHLLSQRHHFAYSNHYRLSGGILDQRVDNFTCTFFFCNNLLTTKL